MDDEKAVGMTTDAKPLPLSADELYRLRERVSIDGWLPERVLHQLFATIAQQAEQIAMWRGLVVEARDHAYNPFEPDNQGNFYKRLDAALNQRGDNE